MTYWIGQVAWGSSKSIGDTAGYEIGGWGATAGAEIRHPGRQVRRLAQLSVGQGRRQGDGQHGRRQPIFDRGPLADAVPTACRSRPAAAIRFIDFDGKRFFRSEKVPTPIERHDRGQLERLACFGTRRSPARNFGPDPSSSAPRPASNITASARTAMTKRAAAARSTFRSTSASSDELAVNALLIAGFEIGGDQRPMRLLPLRGRGRSPPDRRRLARRYRPRILKDGDDLHA